MEDKIKAKVWEGIVLTVPNSHYECCGKPPDLNAKDAYTAYFENDYGEQIVFQYDYKSKKGTLWHGDYGWEEPVQVMAGETTMIMGEEEREWLWLVWRVATRSETKEFQLRSSLDIVNARKAIYDELLARPEFVGDSAMRRPLLKAKGRLDKKEKALIGLLLQAQIDEGKQ